MSRLVCNGCKNVLLYPRGATNVCCVLCNTIIPLPLPGMKMAQLECRGCKTLLSYPRGATSVKCKCCDIVNNAQASKSNPMGHINCRNCRRMLIYHPSEAPAVKCVICGFVIITAMVNGRVPNPPIRANGTTASTSKSSAAKPHSHSQTVVVENPNSVDECGNLVSNVVVGVTNEKK